MEIEKAVEAADAIIVCLSKGSITKEGYVQRELRIVLDFADYKPEGTLYVIPVRLEECEPPRRLRAWQYADYFEGQRERALERLLVSLRRRADSLDLKVDRDNSYVSSLADAATPKKINKKTSPDNISEYLQGWVKRNPNAESELFNVGSNKIILSNGIEFMRVSAGKFLMGSNNGESNEKPQHMVEIPYDYWMARFPITNEQYNVYVKSKGINHPVNNKDHPAIIAKWGTALDYCQWLNELFKNKMPSGLILRLPTETEWEKSARGILGQEYPWGNTFDKNKCNSSESKKGNTTPVGIYSPQGDSHFGCADMVGNVWEWTCSLLKKYPYKNNYDREDKRISDSRVLRGGSFNLDEKYLRCAYRSDIVGLLDRSIGFRVCLAPPLPK